MKRRSAPASEVGDGIVLVRMEKDDVGRTPGTKYFISISSSEDKICKHVMSTPAFHNASGFNIPPITTRGSSDKLKPYVPTPGDVRRMFGKDKIDENPEYVKGADPDWTEKKDEAILVKSKHVNVEKMDGGSCQNAREDCDSSGANSSERMCTATSGESDVVNNIKINRVQVQECTTKANTAKEEVPPIKKKVVIVEPPQTKVITPVKTKQTPNNQSRRITKNATNKKQKQVNNNKNVNKKNSKSYNVAVDMVKRMKPKHWMSINILYKKLEKDKCVDSKLLRSEIGKIIQDLYGNDSYQYLTINIDKNYSNCVMKLAKILLNIYHEVSRKPPGERAKKINKKVVVKKNEKVVPVRKPVARCTACCTTDVQKTEIKHVIKRPMSPVQCRVLPIRNNVASRNTCGQNVKRLRHDMFTAAKPKVPSKPKFVENIVNEWISVKDIPTEKKGEDKESENQSITPPQTPDSEEIKEVELHNCDSTTTSGDAKDCMLLEMNETRRSLLDLEQSLFTLFASSDDNMPSNDMMMYKFNEQHPADQFFSTTLNLFWLNEQLENNSYYNAMPYARYQTDISEYEECDNSFTTLSAQESDKCTVITNDSFTQGKISIYNRWLPSDCHFNRTYINVFVSVLFGLTAAYLSRDQDPSSDKQTVKVSLKKYLRTLLEGALRLVNDF